MKTTRAKGEITARYGCICNKLECKIFHDLCKQTSGFLNSNTTRGSNQKFREDITRYSRNEIKVKPTVIQRLINIDTDNNRACDVEFAALISHYNSTPNSRVPIRIHHFTDKFFQHKKDKRYWDKTIHSWSGGRVFISNTEYLYDKRTEKISHIQSLYTTNNNTSTEQHQTTSRTRTTNTRGQSKIGKTNDIMLDIINQIESNGNIDEVELNLEKGKIRGKINSHLVKVYFKQNGIVYNEIDKLFEGYVDIQKKYPAEGKLTLPTMKETRRGTRCKCIPHPIDTSDLSQVLRYQDRAICNKDDCLNQTNLTLSNYSLPIECDGSNCNSGDIVCKGKFEKRRHFIHLCEKGMEEDRGVGIRTQVDIPKDEVIGRYCGIVHCRPAKDSKYGADLLSTIGTKKTYIDSRYYGNLTRFINHRCKSPNCKYESRVVDGVETLWVTTNRVIKKGEYLNTSYGNVSKTDTTNHFFGEGNRCNCDDCKSTTM